MKQASIIERIREQEELARKFHEVETRILSVLDFGGLFETLLSEISKTFEIPCVWFTLVEESEVTRMVRQGGHGRLLRDRIGVVSRESFAEVTKGATGPLLANENLAPFYRLLPPGSRPPMRSLAVAPVSLDGEAAGSLNLADPSPTRYQPGLRTDFLERLAVKVSLCLSNVTAHEKIKAVAHRDPLTNLFNRRIMETVLTRETARTRRYGGELSVVFIDLDDFKKVNDTYGHDAGDALLRHLSGILQKTCRDSDLVTRYAGDEFVLVLPETSRAATEQLMARLEGALRSTPLTLPGGEEGCIALSHGIASLKDLPEGGAAELLKLADQRLYERKNGR